MNFFRGIPKEIEEAAFIDGASHWRVLFWLYLPLSKPAISTIPLFTLIGHWNTWFDGLFYMNTPARYPLATYLATLVIKMTSTMMQALSPEQVKALMTLSEKTVRSAQLFIAIVPILLVYPFLQRY